MRNHASTVTSAKAVMARAPRPTSAHAEAGTRVSAEHERRWRRLSWVLAVVVFAVVLAQPAGALEILLDETGAETHGVTPGEEVVWLSVWRQPDEWGAVTVTLLDRILVDEDQDGVVRLEVDGPVPPLSVWVAVDLTTGEAAAAAPEGTPLRWAPEGAIRLRTHGGEVEVDLTRPEMILVRPGLGAFRAQLSDGARGDQGARGDDRVTITPASFRRAVPRVDGPPEEGSLPRAFGLRDVLIGIDAGTLQVVYAEIQ